MKVAFLLSLLSIGTMSLAQQAKQDEKRFDVLTPPTTDLASIAISPDGQKMAFVATLGRRNQLWVCAIDDPEKPAPPPSRGLVGVVSDGPLPLCSSGGRPLPDTDYTSDPFPFWSPDSRSIGFFAAAVSIKRIDIDTGLVRTVVPSGGPFKGASWSREGGADGSILFAFATGRFILAVPATGGPAVPVTQLGSVGQVMHVAPHVLPDGRTFLFYVLGDESSRGVYVGRLGSPGSKRLVSADSAAVYSAGKIFFVRQTRLFSQVFDPVSLSLSGDPVSVDERVPNIGNLAALSSSSGRIAYRSGTAGRFSFDNDSEGLHLKVDVADSVEKQFTWFDRKGNELEKVGNPIDSMDPLAPSLSPDGKTVAFVRTVNGNGDIWLLDTTSGALSQFTDHPARDVFPVFSADGAWIGFSSNRRGGFELHRKELRSKKPEDLVIRAQLAPTTPEAWSRDALFFHRGYHDLMAARADGSVVQLARGSANSTLGHSQISPDGAWLALPSNRSGRMEIHVARLSTSTFQILPPVSVGGGEWPRWSRDGKELFYVAPDGMLMAVPFNPSNGRSGQPEKLFAPPMANSFRQAIYYSQYMVAPDGRFLVVCIQKTQSPIHVIDYGPPRGIR